MKPRYKRFIIFSVLVLIITILFKQISCWSAFYALSIYPVISRLLFGFSSVFPFSLYDVFVAMTIILLVVLVLLLFKKRLRKRVFWGVLAGSVWLYIAFYLLWGINYFAPGLSIRNNLPQVSYDSLRFDAFLKSYVSELNQSKTTVVDYSEVHLQSLIRTGYDSARVRYQLPALPPEARTKPMLFGRFYAAMGIRGYYGPFFGEAHVNPYYLPHEKGFVQVHELAHLGGITSEAEANLFAYLITTASTDSTLRFSGYYAILPYVLKNARAVLSESDFNGFVQQIDPDILNLYRESRIYWQHLYSQRLGQIQNSLYEIYLKGNNISSGTANYSEVVGLLIALREK